MYYSNLWMDEVLDLHADFGIHNCICSSSTRAYVSNLHLEHPEAVANWGTRTL